MNTAVINIKTEPKTKKEAQKIAQKIGVSLSSLINAYLKHVVRTKKVEFDLSEEPSDYLIKAMKKADKDLAEGKASPTFKNAEEAIKWLHEQKV